MGTRPLPRAATWREPVHDVRAGVGGGRQEGADPHGCYLSILPWVVIRRPVLAVNCTSLGYAALRIDQAWSGHVNPGELGFKLNQLFHREYRLA